MPDYSADIQDYFDQRSRLAQSRALLSPDTSPDDAAQALDLETKTGAPATETVKDIKGYTDTAKGLSAAHLVANSPRLQDYVNAHPLNASVSAGDLGQLHTALDFVDRSKGPVYMDVLGDVYKSTFESIRDVGRVPDTWKEVEPDLKKMLLGMGMDEAAADREVTHQRDVAIRGGAIQDLTTAAFTLVFGPLIAGYRKYVAQPAGETLGVPPEVIEGYTMVGLGGAAMLHMHLSNGKAPPNGVAKIVDDLKKQQATEDLQKLKKLSSEIQKSETLERHPDSVTELIREPEDPKFGINAEVVRKLYGEELPAPGDGKLGDAIPDLAEQLAHAEQYGGDVVVPKAEWLTKVEPEIQRELEDHLRVRDNGWTKEEGKEHEPKEIHAVNEIDHMRQAANVEAKFGPEIKLQKKPMETPDTWTDIGTTPYNYELLDKEGKRVGELRIEPERGGKQLYIGDMIGGEGKAAGEPGALGLAAIRQLLPQIAAEFPDAEKVGGWRVTGARAEAGAKAVTWIDLKKFRQAPPPVEPKAVGMSEGRSEAYTKAMDEERTADRETNLKRAERYQTKTQTAKWKEDRAAMKDEVEKDMHSRPDIAAYETLRRSAAKIDPSSVPPAAREGLPKWFFEKGGISADDLGGYFGYQTGERMLERVRQLHEQSKSVAGDLVKLLVNIETDARMEAKYGRLSENILTEIMDQVLSPETLQRIHEETIHVGELAKVEGLPIKKVDVETGAAKIFDATLMHEAKANKFLDRVGRIWTKVEGLLLEGKATEAYTLAQQRGINAHMARLAVKIEDKRAKFDKFIERYSKLNTLLPSEYMNFTHQILAQAGIKVGRTMDGLAQAISEGDHKSLADFIQHKVEVEHKDITIPDFILAGTAKKGIDTLTVAEFRALDASVRSMIAEGRGEQKVFLGDKEYDKKYLKEAYDDQLTKLPKLPLTDPTDYPRRALQTARYMTAGHLLLFESKLNRGDRGNLHGILHQSLIYPLARAGANWTLLARQFSDGLKEVPFESWRKLRKAVENTNILNPSTKEFEPMTRNKNRVVLFHMGNPSSWEKFTRGWKVADADALKAEAMKNATENDWKWARTMGELFNKVGKMERKMERDLTNTEPYEAIATPPVDIEIEGKAQTVDGWFSPIRYDERFGERTKKLMGGDVTEDRPYVAITAAPGHYKGRTNYFAPVSLDPNAYVLELNRRVRNVALRPVVKEAGKMLFDPDVRSLFAERLGETSREMIRPYLDRMLHGYVPSNKLTAALNAGGEWLRQNIVADLVGISMSVLEKHTMSVFANSMAEVGPKNFLQEIPSMLKVDDFDTVKNNWKFVLDNSEECNARIRGVAQTLMGAEEQITGRGGFREEFMHVATWPVGMLDLTVSVLTWQAEYRKQIAFGIDHDVASSIADNAVVRAHGSTTAAHRPLAMTGGALARSFTSVYTYMNSLLQRQYEALWRMKDAPAMFRESKEDGYRNIGKIAMLLTTSVIIPAWIEEQVSPYATGKDEGLIMTASKALIGEVASGWPVAREFVHGLLLGHTPSSGGIYQALAEKGGQLANDITRKNPVGKEHQGKLLEDGVGVFGMLTGRANAAIGKLMHFIVDYHSGQQKPRGVVEWGRGVTAGDIQKRGPAEAPLSLVGKALGQRPPRDVKR